MLLLGQVYHFPSSSGRIHVLKTASAFTTQLFQKSTKCAHTEITVLHIDITYEQLCLHLVVVGMSMVKMK